MLELLKKDPKSLLILAHYREMKALCSEATTEGQNYTTAHKTKFFLAILYVIQYSIIWKSHLDIRQTPAIYKWSKSDSHKTHQSRSHSLC